MTAAEIAQTGKGCVGGERRAGAPKGNVGRGRGCGWVQEGAQCRTGEGGVRRGRGECETEKGTWAKEGSVGRGRKSIGWERDGNARRKVDEMEERVRIIVGSDAVRGELFLAPLHLVRLNQDRGTGLKFNLQVVIGRHPASALAPAVRLEFEVQWKHYLPMWQERGGNRTYGLSVMTDDKHQACHS
eukprot:Gb_11620 [translate_table: standard]